MNRRIRILSGRILGALALIVLAVEFRAAFIGELAFATKPTLVLTPLHAPYLDSDEIARSRITLERELAGSGNHALFPKSLIENFYLERDNATDIFDGAYRGKKEAYALGEALGVERIALVSVYGKTAEMSVHINIHDIATDQLVARQSLKFPDFQSMLDWTDEDGVVVDLGEEIGSTVPGFGAGAWLYLAWLCLILIPVIVLLAGGTPWRGLLELLLTLGMLLGLFSWIYALNGDMDYVQRFVATSGSLQLDDTAAERAATLGRYLAPFLLVLAFWARDMLFRINRRREQARPINATVIINLVAPFLGGLSAFLYAMSLPNFLVLEGIPVLAWFALVPLYLAMRTGSWRRGVSTALLFTGLQALLVNWWQGTFSYVSLPFTVSLTVIQYMPFLLVLAATLRYLPRTGIWAAALLWTAFEWIRSLGFLGYPWGIIGVSQYGHPALIQVASIGGVWAVSLMVHLLSAALAVGFERLASGETVSPLLRRMPGVDTPAGSYSPGPLYYLRPWFPALVAVVLVLLLSGIGALAIAGRDAETDAMTTDGKARQVRILAIQQNTDPRKHDYQLSFDELSRLTGDAMASAAAAGEAPFDLVAWPESGFVPDMRFWLDESRVNRRRGKLVKQMLDWQAATGINLLTGTQDHFYEEVEPDPDDPEGETEVKRIRNSAVYLASDRRDEADREYYYKIRLVPFTENFPYDEQFPKVAELLHNFSTTQWTPGNDHHVFQAPAFSFSTPICFEDVFPDHVRRYVVNGAEVLVNISNDYWANTPLEGYQHAAHAVFRAVENRRHLIRATSSGWTISVDPAGRIGEDWPAFYTPGWTIGEFSLPEDPELSFYTRAGDWLPVVCAVAWAGLVAGELIFRRKKVY